MKGLITASISGRATCPLPSRVRADRLCHELRRVAGMRYPSAARPFAPVPNRPGAKALLPGDVVDLVACNDFLLQEVDDIFWDPIFREDCDGGGYGV